MTGDHSSMANPPRILISLNESGGSNPVIIIKVIIQGNS